MEHVTIRGKQFPTARLWIGDQAGEWGTRQPQECLERNDFRVLIRMSMKRALDPGRPVDAIVSGTGLPEIGIHIADVHYIPTSDTRAVQQARGSITSVSPVESNLFVYASYWKNQIESRLK